MNYLTDMGEVIFRWVLQTTWQAAVLAGLIWVVQWALRKRLSASWRYGLWLLLVVRLLMPGSPRSAVSIFNLTRKTTMVFVPTTPPILLSSAGPNSIVNSFNGTPKMDLPAVNAPRDDPGLAPPGVVVRREPRIDWFNIAFSGWLAGVFFFAARLVWTNVRFRSRIGRHQPIGEETVMRLFNDCRENFQIAHPVRLIESEEVESPAVYGFWRKWLLLPDGFFERFSSAELRHIFLHELAHIKRWDIEANWLTSVLQILHWFNPVMWLTFARMRADRELATDALALAHLAGTENVSYGETILKAVENLASRATQPGLVGIAESKAGLKRRLRAIRGVGAARNWRWAATGVAAIVAGVGLTDAQQAFDKSKASTASGHSTPAMDRAPHISGRILDSNGRPAAGAQVALMRTNIGTDLTGTIATGSGLYLTGTTPHLFNPASGHPMDGPRLLLWNYCTTDAQGRFYLDNLDKAVFLWATQESGCARIATNEFSTNMTVKLEAWGRLEGTLWNYDKIVSHEPVRMGFSPYVKCETNTDEDGRFSFDFVPAGQFRISASGIGESATVKSGETAIVNLGGKGRTVIGKFTIPNSNVKVEFGAIGDTYLFDTMPAQPPRPFKTRRERDQWEVIHECDDNSHVHQMQCAKDGSFRIDQVEPGNYEMLVSIQDRTKPRWLAGYSGYKRTFEIPASKPNDREPLDLGVIELTVNPKL
jgi:beta-lactamase regulating signal transducer with metallopeptidase domain